MTTPGNALIVGASRGLGLGLAGELLARGWHVVATSRDESDGLRRLASEAGPKLRTERVDIDAPAQIEALHGRLTGESFDLIFVVAGVSGDPAAAIHTMPVAEVTRIFVTNAVSPIRFAETFLDRLLPGGTLAFMTSVLGSVALNEAGGFDAYRASKAALNSVMKSASLELGPQGVVCVAVHPGWVRTDMGGAGASRSVPDGAAGIVWAATLPDDGPSGGFFRDGKQIEW